MTAPFRLAPPPPTYDVRDQTEFRRVLELGAANAAAKIQQIKPTTPGDYISLENFRTVAHTTKNVTFEWDMNPLIESVAEYEILQAGELLDPPWPNPSSPPLPSHIIPRGFSQITVTFPDTGVEYIQFEARDKTGHTGPPTRVVIQAQTGLPTVYGFGEEVSIDALFCDLIIFCNDPEGLGGTLNAWTNPGDPTDADLTLPCDGTATIDGTPAGLNYTTLFLKTSDGSTANLLRHVRIHPGRGKIVAFEFVNTKKVSSGIISYTVKPGQAVIDENGHLLPGPIADSLAFALTVEAPYVAARLPFDNSAGNWVYALDTKKLYHWNGSAWIKAATVDGGDLIADTIIVGALAAGAVTATAIAAGAVTAIKISVASLSAISDDMGIILAGSLTSLTGTTTLNLNATGAGKVFDHPAFTLYNDGTATFAGTVTASEFTAPLCDFTAIRLDGAATGAGLTWRFSGVDLSWLRNTSGGIQLVSPTSSITISSSFNNVGIDTGSGSGSISLGSAGGIALTTFGSANIFLTSAHSAGIAATSGTLSLSATSTVGISGSAVSISGPLSAGSISGTSLSISGTCSLPGLVVTMPPVLGFTVGVGAANSGGTGLRALVIPN